MRARAHTHTHTYTHTLLCAHACRSNLPAEYEQLVTCTTPRPPSCSPPSSAATTCEFPGFHLEGAGPSPAHNAASSLKYAHPSVPAVGGVCFTAAPHARKSNLSRASGRSSLEGFCAPPDRTPQPASPERGQEGRGAVVGEGGGAGVGAQDSSSQGWGAGLMEGKDGVEEQGGSAGVHEPLSASLPTPLTSLSQAQGALDNMNLGLSSLSLPDTSCMHPPPPAAASSSSSSSSGGAGSVAKAPPQNAAALAAARKGGAMVGPQLLSPKVSELGWHWVDVIACAQRGAGGGQEGVSIKGAATVVA
eukprot:1157601-Pelagomonas_calceolata.AAC.7